MPHGLRDPWDSREAFRCLEPPARRHASVCPAKLDLESDPLSILAVSVDPGETCDLIEDVMSRRAPAWDGLLDPLSAILLGHGRGEVDLKGPDAAVEHPKAVESGFGPVRN